MKAVHTIGAILAMAFTLGAVRDVWSESDYSDRDASFRAFAAKQEPALIEKVEKALSTANKYRSLQLQKLMEDKRVLKHETQGSALFVELQEEACKARIRFIARQVDHVLLLDVNGDGFEVGFHTNGQIMSFSEYSKNILDGVWMVVHPSGALHMLVRNEKGIPTGNLKEWNDKGELTRDISPEQIAAIEAEKVAAEERRVSHVSAMEKAALARSPENADELKRSIRILKRQMSNLFTFKKADDIDWACEALGDAMKIAGPDAARAALDDAVDNKSTVAAQAACLAALGYVPNGPQDLSPLCLMLTKEWQELEPVKKGRLTQDDFRSGLSAVILGLVHVKKEDLPGMGLSEDQVRKGPSGWLRKVLEKAKSLTPDAKAVEQIESALKGLK